MSAEQTASPGAVVSLRAIREARERQGIGAPAPRNVDQSPEGRQAPQDRPATGAALSLDAIRRERARQAGQ